MSNLKVISTLFRKKHNNKHKGESVKFRLDGDKVINPLMLLRVMELTVVCC